jgi:hypothetical protein
MIRAPPERSSRSLGEFGYEVGEAGDGMKLFTKDILVSKLEIVGAASSATA